MWAAMILSNVAIWIQEVAAGWIMTELTASPVLVSLLQVCTVLPIFLFSLAAGTLGDSFDRRILLIIFQTALIVVPLGLAVLTSADLITPLLLLMFSFLSGTGLAFSSPIRQAVLPLLVPRGEIRPAVTLNSIGFNGARAVGPALGGVVIAAWGAATAFILNAFAYLAVVVVLWSWRPERPDKNARGTDFLANAFEGLTAIRQNFAIRSSMVRSTAFVIFASVTWALLPLIVRDIAGDSVFLYGVGVTAVGLGAVTGGFFLPRLHALFGIDRVVMLGTLLTALPLWILSYGSGIWFELGALLLIGVGWVNVNTSINTAIQLVVSENLRARILSIYLLLYAAAMVVGSLVWGLAARLHGVDMVLAGVGSFLFITLALTRWWPVSDHSVEVQAG